MSYRYGDLVAPYLVINEPLAVEDQHVMDCVRTGANPITDGANGLAVVEVLEAAELSRREGRRVEIAEVRERSGADALPLIPAQRTSGAVAETAS